MTAFRLTNNLDELDRLQDHVVRFADEKGISRKMAFKLNLVIDELFTNIVSCGYRDEALHEIGISLELKGNAIVIRMMDDGIPFNPSQTGMPDTRCALKDRQIGGLGLHLVRNMTNSLCYRRIRNRNILTIKKRLPDRAVRADMEKPDMDIKIKRQDGVTIFGLEGRIDSRTAPLFEERIFEAVNAGENRLILDCDALVYISSAGLRVILKAAKELKRRNGNLVLCAIKDYVLEIFEISGFDSFLVITSDIEEAMAKILLNTP